MTQAQQALAAIKDYVASRPVEDVHTLCLTVWETIIQRAEGYDEKATAEVDPSHTNEEAVFADGSRLWWNAHLNAWETGPEGSGSIATLPNVQQGRDGAGERRVRPPR